MEFLVQFAVDDSTSWVPYASIKEDEPWLTAVYIVDNNLKFKHLKVPQFHWASKRVNNINKITRFLFNLNLTSPKLGSPHNITNRRAPHFLLKTMHGITVPKTPKQALELDLVNGNHL